MPEDEENLSQRLRFCATQRLSCRCRSSQVLPAPKGVEEWPLLGDGSWSKVLASTLSKASTRKLERL